MRYMTKTLVSALIFAGLALLNAPAAAQQDNRSEAELIAALNVPDDSDASVRQFSLATKQLAVTGTEACIPALAAKLDNPRFSHFAHYGLQPNPSPKVDEALFAALKTLKGDLLVGVINSIGVRKSPGAIDALQQTVKTLEDANSLKKVFTAAVAAVGEIGTPEAAEAIVGILDEYQMLTKDQTVLNAIADAAFACARNLENANNSAKAIELYDALLAAEMPNYVKEAATYDGILARGADGLDVVVKNLVNDDWNVFASSLKAVREIPGDKVGETLLRESKKLPAERRAMVLEAIGDRGEKVVLPELIAGVKSDGKAIRLASIRALKTVGDDTAVKPLLDAALEDGGNSDVAKAARYTLIWLPGDATDAGIVDVLKNGDTAARIVATNLVEERRIKAAFPTLIAMAVDKNHDVRQSAIQAIAETAGLDDIPKLFEMLGKATDAGDISDLQKALKSACGRQSQDACAELIISLYQKAPNGANKLFALELLATVCGPKAVDFVASQAWVDVRPIQNKATQVLGEWPDTTVAEQLLKIAKDADHPYQSRALRGYVRLARQFGNMEEKDKITICTNAFDAATRRDDKVLIFDVIRRNPTATMLEYATTYFDKTGFEEDAYKAAVDVADKVQGKPAVAQEALKTVIAKTSDAELKARARRILDRE